MRRHGGSSGFVELRRRGMAAPLQPSTLAPAAPRLERRISNFFVPPKVRLHQPHSVVKLSSPHNGRTFKEEGYAIRSGVATPER
jgi:hypothetical protein